MFAMGPAFFSTSASYATLTLSGTYAAATVGTAYSSDLTINGGDGAYSNPRVTVGVPPAGLTLSIVSGKLRLSGTPTAGGTSSFTVAVDSGDGQTATSAQSVVAVVAGSMASGLHFDGANGSTSFVDVTGKIWTPLGGATISTAQSKFGGASGLFTSNSGLSTAYHSDFDLLGGAFTLRGWVRQTTTGDRRIFALGGSFVGWNGTTGLHLLLQTDTSRRYSLSVANGTAAPVGFSSGGVVNTTNAWEFVEVDCDAVGSGGGLRLYVNGALAASTSSAGIVRPSGNPTPCFGRIAAQGTGNDWIGNMDDWQIIKGVALNSGSSYTVPTAPFTDP